MIKLQNISKTFGKSNTCINALNNINLSINSGELIAIIGTSGSGKSTLLNIIGTLSKPTTGTYLINNIDISTLKGRELGQLRNNTFGFVVQHFALIKDFTVYENVEIPLQYNPEIKRSFYEIKIKSILEKLNILNKKKCLPTELSGGQCQRVAIARALINDADIILADEPTGALDKTTSKEVMDLLIKLNTEGKTIIIVTHDENIANQCKRIIRIEDGCIISDNII